MRRPEKRLNPAVTGSTMDGRLTLRLNGVLSVRRRKRQLVKVACLALALGLAHGLLLCVGCDGHASLHSPLHTHDHTGAEVPLDEHAAENHEDQHSHCSHCVDIPLSMMVGQGYAIADPVHVALPADGATFGTLDTTAGWLHTHSIRALDDTPYFTPLDDIVLVV